jgi:hypothetical protein
MTDDAVGSPEATPRVKGSLGIDESGTDGVSGAFDDPGEESVGALEVPAESFWPPQAATMTVAPRAKNIRREIGEFTG